MFEELSNFNQGVDLAFVIIIGISLFFLVALTGIMIFFAVKYSRKRNPVPTQIEESTKLEVLWIVIPTILVLLMFYYGWIAFSPMRNVPADAMVVKTTAKMWDWVFEYETGKKSKDLVVPVNKAVKLDMYSDDVIHNLFIPAFRVKEDIVPNQENYMWFEAKKVGEYDLYCAEYCGLQHAYMTSTVKVVSEADYQKWVNDVTKEANPEDHPGYQVLKKNACITCHSLDGKAIIAPSFKGLYGKQQAVVDESGNESSITVDDEYIKKSIYEPNAQVPKGLNKGIMQSYTGVVSDEETELIIEFLKTVK